jgi:hypothetical protein
VSNEKQKQANIITNSDETNHTTSLFLRLSAVCWQCRRRFDLAFRVTRNTTKTFIQSSHHSYSYSYEPLVIVVPGMEAFDCPLIALFVYGNAEKEGDPGYGISDCAPRFVIESDKSEIVRLG